MTEEQKQYAENQVPDNEPVKSEEGAEQVEMTQEQGDEAVVEKSPEALEIERLQAENDVLADKTLRAQAELQNVQRRQAKERQDLLKYRSQSLATALLPVIDSLEQALKVEVSDEQGAALKKGVEMAYSNFISALSSEGIEKMVAMDQPFDPNFHQAIQKVPVQEGQQAEHVVQVFQEGYTLHDRVIRPAMVVISE